MLGKKLCVCVGVCLCVCLCLCLCICLALPSISTLRNVAIRLPKRPTVISQSQIFSFRIRIGETLRPCLPLWSPLELGAEMNSCVLCFVNTAAHGGTVAGVVKRVNTNAGPCAILNTPATSNTSMNPLISVGQRVVCVCVSVLVLVHFPRLAKHLHAASLDTRQRRNVAIRLAKRPTVISQSQIFSFRISETLCPRLPCDQH